MHRGCVVILAAIGGLLAGCSGSTAGSPATVQPGEAPSPAADATLAPSPVGPALVFEVEPASAAILLDGELLGVASEVLEGGPVAVDPGLHQILITNEGYQTWRAEVSVKEGPEAIKVTLAPVE